MIQLPVVAPAIDKPFRARYVMGMARNRNQNQKAPDGPEVPALPLPQNEIEFLRVLRTNVLGQRRAPWVEHDDPVSSVGLTQVELEHTTGLSRPSVIKLIGHFGEVLRKDKRDAATDVFAIEPEAGLAVSVDFGHGHVSVAISNLYGKVHHAVECTGALLPRTGSEQIDWAVTQISDWMNDARRTSADVVGVGLALPGPIDRNDEFAVIRTPLWLDREHPTSSPFDRMKAGVHLQRGLFQHEAGWGRKRFVVDNDANLSGLAEHTWGLSPARGATNAIYVEWSRGIGSGLMINGEVYRGNGVAGEIGHIIVGDENTPRCERCGNRGCLEMLAGVQAIVDKIPQLEGVDEAEQVDKLVKLAENDDPVVQEAFREATAYLAKALAPLITTFNPSSIIIGGGLGSKAFDLIKIGLQQELQPRTMPPAFQDVSIVGAIRSSDKGARGRTALYGALAAVLGSRHDAPDLLVSYLRDKVSTVNGHNA